MWQIVGAGYQHAWRAYAQALEAGSTAAFFGHEGVTAAERTEVEAIVGGNFTQRLRRFRPAFLARWIQIHPEGKAEQFTVEWNTQTQTPEAAREWMEWPDLAADVQYAIQAGEPEGSLALLERMKIPVASWQSARRELGEPPLLFKRSEEMFQHACRALAGRCRAWFAWLVVPRAHSPGLSVSADLSEAVFDWTEQIRQVKAPPEVCETPLAMKSIVQKAASEALGLLTALPGIPEALSEPVRNLAAAGSELAELKLRNEPDAAATIYERDAEDHRAQEAAKAIENVLKVASALAAHYQETLDSEEVRRSPLVELLATGKWANRYSVLAALRGALEAAVPITTARMQKGQAFRPVEDWQSLWRRHEAELGPVAKPTPIKPPPAKFRVLGGVWSQEDFNASAAEGEVGALARKLAQAVVPALDLRSLQFKRQKLEPALATSGRRKGKGGGGGGRRIADEYLGMLGAVGEYFVYRQFKEIIPDFEPTNWKSRSREVFGNGPGDDSLGYDFEFYDARGALTLERMPRQYFVEVKSTASDGGADDFEMSMNEWETARLYTAATAGWAGALYVIIRVVGTASTPRLLDILMDPISLHAQGVLDYSSRDLVISVGAPE